jgi:flagellar P-ring protein FlgI
MRPLLAVLILLCSATLARAVTVKELVRFEGHSETILQGFGLVAGLPGTGDSGKELALARPLFEVLRNGGNSLGTPSELANSKSVAMVMVTCTIHRGGAKADDTFDIMVSAVNKPSSLAGGTLLISPLTGPYPGSPVFALAQGQITLEGTSSPVNARVRNGARLIRDITAPKIGEAFDLVLDTPYAGWAAASQIAQAINAKADPQGSGVAIAVDERTVRVVVPVAERPNKAGFLADVMSAEVNSALLDPPAQIVYNSATGAIVVTGDVEIAPMAITHKDLTITTTHPPPVPTVANPIVKRDTWVDIKTQARPSEKAKLSDLLAALKQLNIPVDDQISILEMMHKTGKLQAKIVRD